ncbi:MAG: GGDEF domain-containing protein [Candidatus Sumerlaeia bacterium]|nr:GGDEF domain-containing protein [Candidatus Sumerlaeia bacterium]
MDSGKTTVYYYPFERHEPGLTPGPGRPVIAVYESGELVLWHVLGDAETIIGRDGGLTLTLPDDTVSRRHACIRYENIGDGPEEPRCILEDNKSRNGTFLNGRRISKPVRLKNGDRIFLGASCLVYSIRTEEEIRSDIRLISLATTDNLTGLMNRGWMSVQYEKEFERAIRYKRPMSLIILDLDDFKKVNDTYGHTAGDEVRRRIGSCLSEQSRVHDLPGRYGGEEFAVLLPETPLQGALVIAERLRRSISSLVIEFDTATLHVTASLGVASVEVGGDKTLKHLMQRADQALYSAKRRGKNQVVSAHD